jgi:hypothetical protein
MNLYLGARFIQILAKKVLKYSEFFIWLLRHFQTYGAELDSVVDPVQLHYVVGRHDGRNYHHGHRADLGSDGLDDCQSAVAGVDNFRHASLEFVRHGSLSASSVVLTLALLLLENILAMLSWAHSHHHHTALRALPLL